MALDGLPVWLEPALHQDCGEPEQHVRVRPDIERRIGVCRCPVGGARALDAVEVDGLAADQYPPLREGALWISNSASQAPCCSSGMSGRVIGKGPPNQFSGSVLLPHPGSLGKVGCQCQRRDTAFAEVFWLVEDMEHHIRGAVLSRLDE